MRVLDFFKSYESWLILLIVIFTMDMSFSIMGLSYGFREANPLTVLAIEKEFIYYPFFASAIALFTIMFIRGLWKRNYVKVMAWLFVPWYFYYTSWGWFLLLT